jgi:NPCBM/NEW2 domain
MPWVRSTCGWGYPEAVRNGWARHQDSGPSFTRLPNINGIIYTNSNGQATTTLSLAGFPNVKGIGTHAFAGPTPADVVLDISGRKLTTLKTSATLLDHGSVQFQVLIDGKVMHKTQVMHYGDVDPISLDVTAAKEIVLRVLNDGGDGNSDDSAAWGYARFLEAGAEDPLEEPPAKLHSATDANAALFLAEVHWRLGNKRLARRWYDKAAAWMDKNMTEAEKLCQDRAETGKLLGIAEKPLSAKPQPEKAAAK